MIQVNRLDLSNPKVRTATIHALLNDVAIVGAFYNYWTKNKRVGFMIDDVNVGISAVILGGLIYSAALGGTLVYKYGVGVQRQGEGKTMREEREKGKKEL
jgi:uncharacterized membrane protein